MENCTNNPTQMYVGIDFCNIVEANKIMQSGQCVDWAKYR